MLVSSSSQILPAITDPNNFYLGMYSTTAGRVTSQFASPNLTFNPSANAVTINGSLIVSGGVFYSNGTAFSSGGGSGGGGSGVTSIASGTDISVSASTGAVTVNDTSTLATVTGRGATTSTAITLSGGATIGTSFLPSSNAAINIGSATAWFNNIYGTSSHALYADLAENYAADADYSPGTVVVFGGTAEITISTLDHDSSVAGVISTDPAYLMNGASHGLPVALQGRVPCRVQGPVKQGTVLVTGKIPGVAQAIDNSKFVPGCVIGKSLVAITTNTIETIEVVVGKH